MFWNRKSKLLAKVIAEKCDNCRCCTRICKHHALICAEMQGKIITFVNRPENCTGCGKCVNICPNRAIELMERYC
ncbi:MAG: 4Fe-4S binding protein [Dysgonamonadaceae bacterium]|nr:4Fe-4S binding protein [Dysgonamonadaceae bacterium]